MLYHHTAQPGTNMYTDTQPTMGYIQILTHTQIHSPPWDKYKFEHIHKYTVHPPLHSITLGYGIFNGVLMSLIV